MKDPKITGLSKAVGAPQPSESVLPEERNNAPSVTSWNQNLPNHSGTIDRIKFGAVLLHALEREEERWTFLNEEVQKYKLKINGTPENVKVDPTLLKLGLNLALDTVAKQRAGEDLDEENAVVGSAVRMILTMVIEKVLGRSDDFYQRLITIINEKDEVVGERIPMDEVFLMFKLLFKL